MRSQSNFNQKSRTLAIRKALGGWEAAIMPVESIHAAVYRLVLMVVLNEKGLPNDNKPVPYAFLDQQPIPSVPQA
jgi:hypothetical protein